MIFWIEKPDPAARYRWRRWFAWYPVRVSDSAIAWLEVVETRRVPGTVGAADMDGVEYRSADK